MDIDRALERAMEADDPGPAFAGRAAAVSPVIAAITRPAKAAPGSSASMARSSARSMSMTSCVLLSIACYPWRTRAHRARSTASDRFKWLFTVLSGMSSVSAISTGPSSR